MGEISKLTFEWIIYVPDTFYISDILLHSEIKALQRRLEPKIEARSCIFWPPLYKLGDGWVRCLSGFYQFGLRRRVKPVIYFWQSYGRLRVGVIKGQSQNLRSSEGDLMRPTDLQAGQLLKLGWLNDVSRSLIQSSVTLSESNQPGRYRTRKLIAINVRSMACIKCNTGNVMRTRHAQNPIKFFASR